MLTSGDLWTMSGINLAVALVSIVLFGGMIREKVKPVRQQLPLTVVADTPVSEVR